MEYLSINSSFPPSHIRVPPSGLEIPAAAAPNPIFPAFQALGNAGMSTQGGTGDARPGLSSQEHFGKRELSPGLLQAEASPNEGRAKESAGAKELHFSRKKEFFPAKSNP